MKPLIELYCKNQRERYPNFPDHLRPKPKYTDKTSNGLTKCIIDFLNLSGYQAERISTTGRLIDNTRIVSDILGNQYKIGSTKWIKGSGRKGSADVSSIIMGKSVKIEVKIGADRQSREQKKYQTDIERAGGIYIIAKDWDSFYSQYLKIIENLTLLGRGLFNIII